MDENPQITIIISLSAVVDDLVWKSLMINGLLEMFTVNHTERK